MSLSETIRQGVETAFKAAGDLAGLGDYISSGSQVFDPVTDSYTGDTEIQDIRLIKSTLEEEDLEVNQVSVGDLKFLVPYKDLATVTPGTQDKILYQGLRYNILTYKLLPGDSLWIFYCRRA